MLGQSIARSEPTPAALHHTRRIPSTTSKSQADRLLITTILIGNVHCASCVSTIRETLFNLDPRIRDVHVSILTHEVSLFHPASISGSDICLSLSTAAFEVGSATTTDNHGKLVSELNFPNGADGWLGAAADIWKHPSSGFSRSESTSCLGVPKRSKRKRHLETCSACQLEEKAASQKTSTSPYSQRDFGEPNTLSVEGPQPNDQDDANQAKEEVKQLSLFLQENSRVEKPTKSCEQGVSNGFMTKPPPLPSPAPTLSIRASAPDVERKTFRSILSIGGMTCATCSNTIMNELKDLPYVQSIDVTLMNNSGVIIYTGEEHLSDILSKIDDLGYDCSVESSSILEAPKTSTNQFYRAVLGIGGMTCAACSNAITDGLQNLPYIESIDITLMTDSGVVVFQGEEHLDDILERIDDLGYDCKVESSSTIKLPRKPQTRNYRAILSIGGMTCASCSNAIVDGLKGVSYIESVNVTLMTNSGVVVFSGKEHLEEIVGKVEDLGYDCNLDRLVTLDSSSQTERDHIEVQKRTVKLKVDGMFCEHCPTQVIEVLKRDLAKWVAVNKDPSLKDPIVEITYEPDAPEYTIRDIIRAIDSINAIFRTTIDHPPSIEERSRAMQLHERQRIFRRLIISFVFAIPTLLIGVVWMDLVPDSNGIRAFFETPTWSGSATRAEWALFILATPVMFFAADVFHKRAIKEIRALWRKGSKVPIMRRFYRFGSMNLLMSAGTSVAYFSSIALLGIAATTPKSMSNGSGTTYFDSVVFLTFFILIGRFLEAYSKSKTGDAISMLGKLRPNEALLVTPTSAETSHSNNEKFEAKLEQNPVVSTISVDLLEVGDTIMVPHGASPPTDGVIVNGLTQFDESSLTGESRPVPKDLGEKVFAGAINTGNPTSMRITEVGGTSMLDQIVNVIREGRTKRAPVERVADILTGYFVPVITALAILTFFIWFALGQSGTLSDRYLNGQEGGWAFWSLEFAIAVFVVACPCGIGLAAPTALFVGGGLAAKSGILVQGGGEAFQEASDLDAVVFDKTGTLTEGGDLKVTDFEMMAEAEEVDIAWSITKTLEEQSSHPIARAVVAFASEKPSTSIETVSIEEHPGLGLRGTFIAPPSSPTEPPATYEAALGSESLIASLAPLSTTNSYFATQTLSLWKSQSKSVVILALRRLSNSSLDAKPNPWVLTALLGTTDPVRPSALPTIQTLHSRGISVYMLTGDNPTTAAAVASSLSIPVANVFAGVLPTEKADKITWLQNHAPRRGSTNHKLSSNKPDPKKRPKSKIAFAGDGINDAPALHAATVSISLSSASDIAVSSSSFILLSPSLETIITLLDLSTRVFNRIKFNFFWAVAYNVCLVPVAAGVFFKVSANGWRLGPVWASAAMAASSVSVVLGSLALRWRWRWWRR